MNKVDVSNWKYFRLGDIFEISKTENVVSYSLNDGDFPYVSRTSLNNGVCRYVDLQDKHELNDGNCIIVGGESALAFYQEKPFLTGNNITSLRNENLNKNIGLFICSVLNLENPKFSYGRAWNKVRVESTKIKLPQDKLGNPNWKYMNDYIQSVFSKWIDHDDLSKPANSGFKLSLKDREWKKFTVGDLFVIANGKNLLIDDIYKYPGKVPAVQGGELEHGVLGHLSDNLPKYLSSDLVLVKSPCITLARVGSAGAVNVFMNGCYIGDKSKALFLKDDKFKDNVNVLIFLKGILNKLKYKYSYGRGVVSKSYLMNLISLPVDKQGNVDYEFMNDYICSLPYTICLNK